MKKITLLSFILIFISCGVTYVPVSIVPIEETFEVKEQDKDLLFSKANTWLALSFKSSKNIIQYSDKEAGVLTGRFAIYPIVETNGYGVQQDKSLYSGIHIRVKDNGAKISISPEDFYEVHSSINKSYRFTKDTAIVKSQEMITSFKAYLQQPVTDF